MHQSASPSRKEFIGSAALAAIASTSLAVSPALAEDTDLAAQVQSLIEGLDEQRSISTIDNLIAQYAMSMDYCDPDMGYACAWPEAEFIYDDYFDDTSVAFVDWAMELHTQSFVATHHDMLATWHKIVGDKAVTETRALVHIIWPGEGAPEGEPKENYIAEHLNRYLDYWERRDGEWRIAKRYCIGDISRYEYADSLDLYNDGSKRARGENRGDDVFYSLLALLDE